MKPFVVQAVVHQLKLASGAGVGAAVGDGIGVGVAVATGVGVAVGIAVGVGILVGTGCRCHGCTLEKGDHVASRMRQRQ